MSVIYGKSFLLRTVKHSLAYFFTASSGLHTFPEFVVVSKMDGMHVGYCDSNNKRFTQDWVQELIAEDSEHFNWYTQDCAAYEQIFKVETDSLQQRVNQSGGLPIFQLMFGCEWDDETGEANGYRRYSYDGEDFIGFDLKTLTWTILTPQAFITKTEWDRNRVYNEVWNQFLTNVCPEWLKTFVHYGRSSLIRAELPSVSLLQKSPSSPVSCHATGFYPDRALMLWRKDGEDLHEDVDQGEILPNHDGSFQMRVDLNLSSVKPEDWRRYDCVFQLSGVKEEIITKLDKAEIRSNSGKSEISGDGDFPPSEFPAAPVIGGVVALLLLTLCISGLFIWRRKKDKGFRHTNTSDSSCSSDSASN
ncbi:major histocompatibility complex class I-related gene protein-like [Trachinotus anak]|uniref:major histocompatibility complex class I-related gene protein-like n=1 Tax=Trachinotus anak TaxID=443729 RepID=UPI0039F1E40B